MPKKKIKQLLKKFKPYLNKVKPYFNKIMPGEMQYFEMNSVPSFKEAYVSARAE